MFIIDVSGSADVPCRGSAVGDINGDGRANTILDAELVSILVLSDRLVRLGFGSPAGIAVIPFSSGATASDLDPVVEGVLLATTPNADVDNDGVFDLEAVLRGLQAGGQTGSADCPTSAEGYVDGVGISLLKIPTARRALGCNRVETSMESTVGTMRGKL